MGTEKKLKNGCTCGMCHEFEKTEPVEDSKSSARRKEIQNSTREDFTSKGFLENLVSSMKKLEKEDDDSEEIEDENYKRVYESKRTSSDGTSAEMTLDHSPKKVKDVKIEITLTLEDGSKSTSVKDGISSYFLFACYPTEDNDYALEGSVGGSLKDQLKIYANKDKLMDCTKEGILAGILHNAPKELKSILEKYSLEEVLSELGKMSKEL